MRRFSQIASPVTRLTRTGLRRARRRRSRSRAADAAVRYIGRRSRLDFLAVLQRLPEPHSHFLNQIVDILPREAMPKPHSLRTRSANRLRTVSSACDSGSVGKVTNLKVRPPHGRATWI